MMPFKVGDIISFKQSSHVMSIVTEINVKSTRYLFMMGSKEVYKAVSINTNDFLDDSEFTYQDSDELITDIFRGFI